MMLSVCGIVSKVSRIGGLDAQFPQQFGCHNQQGGAYENGRAERQRARQFVGKAELAEEIDGQRVFRAGQEEGDDEFIEGSDEAEQQA